MTIITRLTAFAKNERGTTAIEYGLFAALVAAVIVGVIVGAVSTLRQHTNSGFSTVSTALSDTGIAAPIEEEPVEEVN